MWNKADRKEKERISEIHSISYKGIIREMWTHVTLSAGCRSPPQSSFVTNAFSVLFAVLRPLYYQLATGLLEKGVVHPN
jgi:hypothetical protein